MENKCLSAISRRLEIIDTERFQNPHLLFRVLINFKERKDAFISVCLKFNLNMYYIPLYWLFDNNCLYKCIEGLELLLCIRDTWSAVILKLPYYTCITVGADNNAYPAKFQQGLSCL